VEERDAIFGRWAESRSQREALFPDFLLAVRQVNGGGGVLAVATGRHTSCLSLPSESDRLEVYDFPYAFSDLQNRPREGKIEGFS
jgi:hypothetical protein